MAQQDNLAAPEFWLIEAANMLWKRSRRGHMTAKDATAAFATLQSAQVAPIGLAALLPDAMRYAVLLDHAVYDCIYIAAAIQNNATLVTADRKLLAVVSPHAAIASHVKILD